MMTSVYNDAHYLGVYKQKQKIWWTFIAVTLVYAIFCVSWWIYYMSLPYEDPMQALPMTCVYVATALYVVFSFPFLGIKFSRVRRYFKMLSYVSEGLKMEEKNYFYCFDEKSLQKDNIDVIACVFETWNKKKSEWMERETYFDPEMPLPQFESGDYVRYVSQSNFVIQYEILERRALEFEEVDDEEYEEETQDEAQEVDEAQVEDEE